MKEILVLATVALITIAFCIGCGEAIEYPTGNEVNPELAHEMQEFVDNYRRK